MTDYESDKARYWRNCDVWTFSEVQFLLDGRWPVQNEVAPTSLSITLVTTQQEIIHTASIDGEEHYLIEECSENVIFNPVPDHILLTDLIEDAVSAGCLTPLPAHRTPKYKRDFEARFQPSEVIAWANARGCFPDFPFGDKGSTGAAGPGNNNETLPLDHPEDASEVQAQHQAHPTSIANDQHQMAESPTATNFEFEDKESSIGNWKTKIQEEAASRMKKLREAGANPTVHSLLDGLVRWCRENDIKTDSGIYPANGYLRTHVLSGKHWTPPI